MLMLMLIQNSTNFLFVIVGAIDIHSQSPVSADRVYLHGPNMGGSSHG